MNQGKFIFAQLKDFFLRRVFDSIVDKYEGNKYLRSFICWNQMLCMVFGQLAASIRLYNDRPLSEHLLAGRVQKA